MTYALRWGRVSRRWDYATPENKASGLGAYGAAPCSFAQNDAGTPQREWHKSDTANSRNVPGIFGPDDAPKNENPGALAGATGAKSIELDVRSKRYNSTESRATCHEAADAIRRLCRAGSSHFKVAVAWGALKELDPEDAAKVAAAFVRAGPPVPAFDGVMAEAAFWADMATPTEHAAYALACFARLSPDRQTAFLAHVQEGRG